MPTSWQTTTDHLVCRWSDLVERHPYCPLWITGSERDARSPQPSSVPDLRSLSSFGGGQWYLFDLTAATTEPPVQRET